MVTMMTMVTIITMMTMMTVLTMMLVIHQDVRHCTTLILKAPQSKPYYIHNRGVHTVLKDTYSSSNIRTTAMHTVLKDTYSTNKIRTTAIHTILKDTYCSNNIRTTAMHTVLKDAWVLQCLPCELDNALYNKPEVSGPHVDRVVLNGRVYHLQQLQDYGWLSHALTGWN